MLGLVLGVLCEESGWMGTRAKEGLVWRRRFCRLIPAIYSSNRLSARRACHSDRTHPASEVSGRRSRNRFPDGSGTGIPNWRRQWLLQYLVTRNSMRTFHDRLTLRYALCVGHINKYMSSHVKPDATRLNYLKAKEKIKKQKRYRTYLYQVPSVHVCARIISSVFGCFEH